MKRIYTLCCLMAALAVALCPFPRAWAVKAGFTVFHGDRAKAEIAVTVDDCYNIENVAEILDLCEEYGIPITFFVVGQALSTADQAVWQRALDLGCEIGNHTWSHPRLPGLSREAILKTLSSTQKKLNEVLGYSYDMQLMRPPYGSLSEDPDKKSDLWVVETIDEAGYLHAVRWDVDETDPDKALADVDNGSILLYHANRADVRCPTKLIPALIDAGYTCVTTSELLGYEPPSGSDLSQGS